MTNDSSPSTSVAPRGELSVKVLAMPADTNQNGDIFGGWLLGQMDIAGSVFAHKVARGRTVTVAVDAMSFRKPVFVGDVVCIYTESIRVGHTSLCVHIEAWVIRQNEEDLLLVTEGNFTYVAIDSDGRPRPVPG
jgi:acyl-CoA thioesterase YciA